MICFIAFDDATKYAMNAGDIFAILFLSLSYIHTQNYNLLAPQTLTTNHNHFRWKENVVHNHQNDENFCKTMNSNILRSKNTFIRFHSTFLFSYYIYSINIKFVFL